ncbi:MAG: TIGR02147 family protein [Deltaproteobacteria bacterium]|nr:TIGR02147 family protein [Deltaproteobacteria bacterium]
MDIVRIFHYQDYRLFLTDTFAALKEKRPQFSHRAFNRLAGFASPNYLLLVMQGKRNLSSDGIQKVAKALKLGKREAGFFENLVRFNQSASEEERDFYYQRLLENKEYAEEKRIEKWQYEYYSTWHHAAIRELTLLSDFQEDEAWIAQQFDPALTRKDVRGSLELLEKLGLLSRDACGKLVQQEPYIDTGNEVASLAVSHFHREMLIKASEALKAPAEKREFSGVTFAVSEQGMTAIKKLIQDLRRKVAAIATQEKEVDAVYQLNVQLFPLTKDEEET